LRIDKDSFQISKNWESTNSEEKILDSLKLSINQNIQIRLVSFSNGVGGLPFKTKLSDYHISIIPTEKYCMLKDVKITVPAPYKLDCFLQLIKQFFHIFRNLLCS
jgi:hypothetical protein